MRIGLKKGFLVPLGIMAAVLLVFPVQGMTSDLTLSKAVETALSRNPGLQASGFGVLSAQEKIIQARSGAMPRVYLSGRSSRTTNPMWAFGTKLNQESITAGDFDPDRLNNPDGITNYASTLLVAWPVYDSGQTWYGLQQAQLNHEAAALFETRTRQQVVARTITAYIGALFAREKQTVIQQILETARSHQKLVASRYKGGFVAKSDLLRAQVQIADLEQQLAEAKSQTDISKCQLNVAMGVDGSPDYTLSTRLKADAPVTGSLESWIGTALSNRPDLKHLEFQKQIAQKEIGKSKASRNPSVSLAGNYEVNSEDFNEAATNYTIGAVVSMPLFTGGLISAKIREAGINLQQVTTVLKGMEQQICGETRQAFFNAQSAWERIRVTQAAVGQSRESLRIVKNRYNSGLFTITDLLDAQVMVQQSMTHQIKAIHDYKAAATRLDLAAGIIDPP
jgi:outer membrane protein